MISPDAPKQNRALLSALLHDQQDLTAVERFAQRHENHPAPLQSRYYSDLIPLTLPRAHEQYAFEVNLDSCSGCKACVTACHNLNGLDDGESWRDVGLLLGDPDSSRQQTITTACHHCVDPACLNGCPVLAYDKDPLTGIVRHLDDQCIGCQYCILKCPYEVPKYSPSRGIVRKCDMCHSRLAAGEAPACVQACPSGAIAIRISTVADIVERGRTASFLPDSPDPAYTLPSTHYTSSSALAPEMQAGDRFVLKQQPAHWPLVFMLVLTQLGAGLLTIPALMGLLLHAPYRGDELRTGVLAALASALMGIGVSVLHLGRPSQAWRSFLGWRRSWLSREILCFGAFAGVTLLAGISVVLRPAPTGFIPSTAALAATAAGIGLIAVGASVMVYHDTHRSFWRFSMTASRFFGTVFLLGLSGCWVIGGAHNSSHTQLFPWLLMGVAMIKLVWELEILRHLFSPTLTPLKRSALLIAGPLRRPAALRGGAILVGGIILPLVFALGSASEAIPVVALFLCFAGELLERYLFFTAVAPTKMPGAL